MHGFAVHVFVLLLEKNINNSYGFQLFWDSYAAAYCLCWVRLGWVAPTGDTTACCLSWIELEVGLKQKTLPAVSLVHGSIF